jgi:hypothetical protein
MSSTTSPSATESSGNIDLETFVLSLAWTCLHDTPTNQKNVLYDEFISSASILNDLASACSLEFAPGLNEVLRDDAPPTIQYFTTLPGDAFKGWGVYLLVFVKPSHPSRIYIGSATDSEQGICKRWACYNYECTLPKYVKETLDEGYTNVHQGLLCWTPSIPTYGLQPTLRLFFLVLEAMFSYVFWAMRTITRDYGMAHLCLWDRHSLEYTGLCSHCCLTEGVRGDFSLSSEQLEALAAQRKKFRAERNGAKAAARSLDYHYMQMATNRDQYLDDMNQRNRESRARNPERYRALEISRRTQHKISNTYYCEICKTSCRTKSDLDEHKATAKHLQKIADTVSKEKRFNCDPCAYATDKSSSWNDHCRSKRHRNRVATSSSSELV